MKTFTEKQLFDWLKEQPDDRLIDMGNGWLGGEYYTGPVICGCILSEFFRDQGLKDGYASIHGEVNCRGEIVAKVAFETERNIFRFFGAEADENDLQTIGSLKKGLKNKNLIS